MSQFTQHEASRLLQRVLGKFARRPAVDVALWLACIPLILPAPVIAGVIAGSARAKGDKDASWNAVILLSILNFLISSMILAWIASVFGEWILERLRDFLGPFFLWPEPSTPETMQV